jgi:hypothetical protein
MRRIYLVIAVFISLACGEETKRELEISEKELSIALVKVDSLQAILTDLQQTPDYFYQGGVSSRNSQSYSKSNQFLGELIERFPKHTLAREAKRLISKNNTSIMDLKYKTIKGAVASKGYPNAISLVDNFEKEYPRSNRLRELRQIKKNSQREIAKQKEQRLKAGSDVELVKWSWLRRGEFFEITGQVKNISNKSLTNVMVVATMYDKNETFITSGEALISYNPLLVGQTSPFKKMVRRNPAMEKAAVTFKYLMGGTIPTYRK